MDNINLLLEGFATALQPQYLVFAFLGVLVGTAVGVLPGIGPAMTVALLLPLTYTLDPTAALITFAGIYYGAMYGGSTTSILLNTPGESASIITAIEGHKMAKLGRAATALATAAIGSFIAGTIATVGTDACRADPRAVRGGARSCRLCGADRRRIHHRGRAARLVGVARARVARHRPVHRADRHRPAVGSGALHPRPPPLADGVDVVLVAVGLFAVGETLYVASRLRHGPVQVIPMGASWRHAMKTRRLEALLEAMAARHRDRVPDRHDPGRRRGRRDLPVVRDGEEAVQAQAGVRSRSDRGRCGSRVGQQRGCSGCACAAADPRASDYGDRRDHPHGVPVVRHPARPAPLRESAGAGVGAHREPLHRQCDAHRAEPARLWACGRKCCASRVRTCMRGS